KLVAGGKLDPTVFVTHRFPMEETMNAYEVFADPATTNALKLVLTSGAQRPDAAAIGRPGDVPAERPLAGC
ncbi:MAG TPA: hypothetical protein VKI99_02665, partial [Candidatus Dormibacteraeota bacterium]|nr:hypothetical protein [Candidatus Dormibacteraeota bacterium]